MNSQRSNYPVYPPPPPDVQFGYSPVAPYPGQRAQQHRFSAFPYPPQQQTQFIPHLPPVQQNIPPYQAQQPATQHALPSSISPPTGPGAPPPEPNSPDEDDNEHEDEDETMNGAAENVDGEGDGEGNAQQGAIFHIPPPPEKTYANEEELEKAVHDWSREHGYELVRRASKRNAKGKMYKRYLHCSKHGKKRTDRKLVEESRQRNGRKSNRIDCPMSIAVVALDPNHPEGEWQVRHRKTHHNHGPLEAKSLAGHRRRERMGAVEKAVDGLFEIGAENTQILHFLHRMQPNGLFTRADVANMKNRYRKWGSCADRITRGDQHQASAANVEGRKRACTQCRQHKVGCGGERPQCSTCIQTGRSCAYDHEPPPENDEENGTAANPQPFGRASKRGRPRAVDVEQTERILATLRTLGAAEPAVPTHRLDLTSSEVETLAHSSSGNGDSFLTIPYLMNEREWPKFRDAMLDASRRENTHDVLTGIKISPKPPASGDSDLAAWNEHIKQLAIHTRRNELLMSAILSKLGPSFRVRVQNGKNASEVWRMLEDICAPQGCATAYNLYTDLFGITLANSENDLKSYISRLDTLWAQFKVVPVKTPCQAPGSGGEVVTDATMAFLFLRGLGEGWKHWVDGIIVTANIGGFGTGERVGFREICARAVGIEQAMGRAR